MTDDGANMQRAFRNDPKPVSYSMLTMQSDSMYEDELWTILSS